MDDFEISNTQIGSKRHLGLKWSTCHGGKKEGVHLIDVNADGFNIQVCPSRGMNVVHATFNGVYMGWSSPVHDLVNPAFINLYAREGCGFLDGFNECVARTGFGHMGHPGMDNGEMLTLHGRASNTPADDVIVDIHDDRIVLLGTLREQCFKKINFEIQTRLEVYFDRPGFVITDTLTNQGDYESEYMVMYHNNFGSPLLEEGSKVIIPVKKVAPFNEYAASDLSKWDTLRGPTRNFDEMVYNLFPIAEEDGQAMAVLHNAKKNKALGISFDPSVMPAFTLWKNTDTMAQGYCVGLQPGTSLSYNRRYQRELGLVPKIGPKETRIFRMQFDVAVGTEAVEKLANRAERIQKDQPTLQKDPLVDLSK